MWFLFITIVCLVGLLGFVFCVLGWFGFVLVWVVGCFWDCLLGLCYGFVLFGVLVVCWFGGFWVLILVVLFGFEFVGWGWVWGWLVCGWSEVWFGFLGVTFWM